MDEPESLFDFIDNLDLGPAYASGDAGGADGLGPYTAVQGAGALAQGLPGGASSQGDPYGLAESLRELGGRSPFDDEPTPFGLILPRGTPSTWYAAGPDLLPPPPSIRGAGTFASGLPVGASSLDDPYGPAESLDGLGGRSPFGAAPAASGLAAAPTPEASAPSTTPLPGVLNDSLPYRAGSSFGPDYGFGGQPALTPTAAAAPGWPIDQFLKSLRFTSPGEAVPPPSRPTPGSIHDMLTATPGSPEDLETEIQARWAGVPIPEAERRVLAAKSETLPGKNTKLVPGFDTTDIQITPGQPIQVVPPEVRAILNVISRGEGANSNYDKTYDDGKYDGGRHGPPSEMSVDEVRALQRRIYANAGQDASPVGAYQIVGRTVDQLRRELPNLTGNSVYTKELQDRLGLRLLEDDALNDYLSGKISADTYQDKLAGTWDGLPKSTDRPSIFGAEVRNAILGLKALNGR